MHKSKKVTRTERGFTLIEMMFASIVMIVGIVGLMALFTVATIQNSTQGDQATRTTEYAQDKMEQIMVLSFNDSTSDLTQYPTPCIQDLTGTTCTGTGLGGNMDGSTTAKGGLVVSSPVAGYVDYMSKTGTPVTSSAGAAYIRQWQITADGLTPAQIKTITVQVTALNRVGQGALAQTTLISQKASF